MRISGFLLIAVLVCWPSPCMAQELTYKVAGLIKQVDIQRGAITIRPSRKGATEDESYSFLKKDVGVTAPGGQKAQLNALMVGQTVQLTIGFGGDVEAVAIQAPAYLATIADVDPKNRTIKIARPENQSTTLPVAADARILLAGRSAFLREIAPGSEMNVTASLDGKTVVGLNLISHPEGKLATKLYPRVKVSKFPGTRIVGVVTAVDPIKNELSVTGPKTKYVAKTYPLAKAATIQVLRGQVAVQELRLNQLAKMTNATVIVSAEDQVTRVFVDAPTAAAKVKQLNGDTGALSVELGGAVKTVELRSDFKVMNGTRVLRLGDLQVEASVTLVLSHGRDQVLAADFK